MELLAVNMLAFPLALLRFAIAEPNSGEHEDAYALVAESFSEYCDL